MKPKNYTDKSAMLVGTDADPVTAGPKYFAENTPEQEKENAEIRQSSMYNLSLIHISEPTRLARTSRMPSSA